MAKVKRIISERVFQLKITLNHVKPPVWRRFLVGSDIKLPDLHKVIQTVMGWTNSHLHQFIVAGTYYTLPEDDFAGEVTDYRKIKLESVIDAPKAKFEYEYDFGDGWEHVIVLEKVLPRMKDVHYPVCVGGKRNCPPEDCGGPGGYEDLLGIVGDPKHVEYEGMMEWLGGEFDPEEFDIEAVNESLREKDYGCIELFD